ncbi:MAG: hypothetical protein Q9169_002719 [Polycauliona sp. 2 TL-2023]
MASTFPPASIRPILNEVTSLLKSRNETISVAETVSLPPSTSFSPSVASASLTIHMLQGRRRHHLCLSPLRTRRKIQFAGWTEENTKNYKGPNAEVVTGLAENVRAKLGSTYCLSESGTAGPGGSGDAPNRKPDFVALAVASDTGTQTEETTTGADGDREKNMVEFARLGLMLLKDVILRATDGAKI